MSKPEPILSENASPRGAVAGVAIVLSSLVGMIAVAHHPSAHHVRDGADLLAQIVALRVTDQAVHAAAIAAEGGLLFGFLVFALRRGIRGNAVLAGLVGYAVGAVAVIGAAAIDGFITPALAAHYAAASPAEISVAVQLITACAIAIQVLTKIWLFAVSLAVIVWSAGIVRGTPMQRGIAVLGFASSALLVVAGLLAGNVNAHTLGVIVLVQTVWAVAIGVLMIRDEI